MKVSLDPEARQDLSEIQNEIREEIVENIEDLKNHSLPEKSYVIRLPDGTEVQCLKLQEENRNSDFNHRVTYDINGKQVRIYRCIP